MPLQIHTMNEQVRADLLGRFNAIAGQALQHGSATKHGWGRIGKIGGRVFKFNTHHDQYSKDSRGWLDDHRIKLGYVNPGQVDNKYGEMQAACLELRQELVNLTRQLYGVGGENTWANAVPKSVLTRLKKIGVTFNENSVNEPRGTTLSDELFDRSAVGKWVLAVKKSIAQDVNLNQAVKDQVADMRGVAGSYARDAGRFDAVFDSSGQCSKAANGLYSHVTAGYQFQRSDARDSQSPYAVSPAKRADWEHDGELQGVVEKFSRYNTLSKEEFDAARDELCRETKSCFAAFAGAWNEAAQRRDFVNGLIDRLGNLVDLKSLKEEFDAARAHVIDADSEILDRYLEAIRAPQEENPQHEIGLVAKADEIEEPRNQKFLLTGIQACLEHCARHTRQCTLSRALNTACGNPRNGLTPGLLLRGILTLPADRYDADRKELFGRAADKFLEAKTPANQGVAKLRVRRLIATRLEAALKAYDAEAGRNAPGEIDVAAVLAKLNEDTGAEQVVLNASDVRELLNCVFDCLFDDCWPGSQEPSIKKIESSFTVRLPEVDGERKTHSLKSEIIPADGTIVTNLAFSKLEEEGGNEIVSFVRCGNAAVRNVDNYYGCIAEVAVLNNEALKKELEQKDFVEVNLFQVDLSGHTFLTPAKNEQIVRTITDQSEQGLSIFNGKKIRVNVKRLPVPVDSEYGLIRADETEQEIQRLVKKGGEIKADEKKKKKIGRLIESINAFWAEMRKGMQDNFRDNRKLGPQLIQFGAQMAMLSYLVGETPVIHCHMGKDRTSLMDSEVKQVATKLQFAPNASLKIDSDETEEKKARNTEFVKRTGNLEAAISMDNICTYTPLLNQSGGVTQLYNHYKHTQQTLPDEHIKHTLDFRFDHTSDEGIPLEG